MLGTLFQGCRISRLGSLRFSELPLCLSLDFLGLGLGSCSNFSLDGLGCRLLFFFGCAFSTALSTLSPPLEPSPHHAVQLPLLLLPLLLHELLDVSDALLMSGQQGFFLALIQLLALVDLLDHQILA